MNPLLAIDDLPDYARIRAEDVAPALASALDACQHGFLPFVVREACGDRHPAPHEANLFDLQAKYAEVIGEAAALAHLASPR